MKRYSLSICELYSQSEKNDFRFEYDTLEEVNAKIDDVIKNSISEGLYRDKNDYLDNNGVIIYDNKYEVSVFRNY